MLLDDILNRLVKLESRVDAAVNISLHNSSHTAGVVFHKPIKQNKSGSTVNVGSNHPQTLYQSGT